MTDKLPLPIVCEYCNHKIYNSSDTNDNDVYKCSQSNKIILNPFGHHCENWDKGYSHPDIFEDPRVIQTDQEIRIENTSTKEEPLKLDIHMTITLQEPINQETIAETRLILDEIAGKYTGKLNSLELREELQDKITSTLRTTLNKE